MFLKAGKGKQRAAYAHAVVCVMAKVFNINGEVTRNSAVGPDWKNMERFVSTNIANMRQYTAESESTRKIFIDSISSIKRMMEKAGVSETIYPSRFLVNCFGKPLSYVYNNFIFENICAVCCSMARSKDDFVYLGKIRFKNIVNPHAESVFVKTESLLYRFSDGLGIYERYEEKDNLPSGEYRWSAVPKYEALGITDRQREDISRNGYLNDIFEAMKNGSAGFISDEEWDRVLTDNREILNVLKDPVADRTLHPIIVVKENMKRVIYLVPRWVTGFAVSYDDGSGMFCLRAYGPDAGTSFIDMDVDRLDSDKLHGFIEKYLNRAFYGGVTYVIPLSKDNIVLKEGVSSFKDIDFDGIRKTLKMTSAEEGNLAAVEAYRMLC